MLQNECRLYDLSVRTLLCPLRRLQLHLPVNAGKVATLLQDRLQQEFLKILCFTP